MMEEEELAAAKENEKLEKVPTRKLRRQQLDDELRAEARSNERRGGWPRSLVAGLEPKAAHVMMATQNAARVTLAAETARLASVVMQAPQMPLRDLTLLGGLDPAKDFRDLDLSSLTLVNEDLRGFDLSGCDLRGTGLAEQSATALHYSLAQNWIPSMPRSYEYREKLRWKVVFRLT